MKRITAFAIAARAAPAEAELHRLGDGQFPLDWNGPVDRPFVRFQDEDLDKPIIDHLEAIVGRQPDRVAVTDGDETLTYAALWDGLSGLAEYITALTKPGDAVAILLPPHTMAPLAMLACIAAGRPFLMLDVHAPRDWLTRTVRDAQPTLVIAGHDAAKGVETGAASVIELDTLPQRAAPGWRRAALGVDEPACILFTSGSTGHPKGIVNSQRNLLQRVAQSINAAHINADDRFLTLASLCTIVGVRDVMTALLAGARIRLVDPQRTGPREALSVIRNDAITILFAFPALLRSLMTAKAEPGATLRLVRAGGDTLVWGDIDQIRERLAPDAHVQLIYAATEAPMMQWFVADSFRRADARVPIGYPLPGNRLAIVNDRGCSASPGEFGELVVESPYVSLGLWENGRLKTESVEHGAASASRVFRSGDLVRQRPDGLLERAGRIDRQVKIRGSRVDLDGVEAVLRGQPFVHDVGAVARNKGPDGSQMLVAYVCIRPGAPDGILDDIKVELDSAPAAMRPARIYVVPEIPRLPSSKLDNHALLAMDETRASEERVTPAAISAIEDDHIARSVAQVWRDILNLAVSSPDDDFFESGGDSLQALSFTLKVEEALGVELPVTLINEAPSFGAFCSMLRQGSATRYTPLVLLKSGNRLPPVFLIHGVGGNVTEMLPMARCMAYPGPVFGIQARGLVGDASPHISVEAMAAEYLHEIKLRQPSGPYYLCGYSFGGLVAFEIAKSLHSAGEEVGLVGLFDTLMSPLKWPLRAWVSIAWRKAGRLLTGQAQRTDRVRTARVLKVSWSALYASAKYRPGFYPGVVTLFSPAEREPGLPAIEDIWRKHAGGIVTILTSGSHATMLSGHNAELTAARLTDALTG
jgi:non-ribosomal peptide synthetase component F/thioesterase domain-containing protein/acyl carrier protein